MVLPDARLITAWRAKRRVNDVADGLAVNRLHGRVRPRLAVRPPDDHHRNLLHKRSEFLRVQALGERLARRDGRGRDERFERGLYIEEVGRAKDVVALAVVREVSRLEHERVAELGAGGEDGGDEDLERVVAEGGCRGGDGEEGGDGYPPCGEVLLLSELVLDDADDGRRGEDLDALARATAGRLELVRDGLERCDVDVLNLDREDVDLLR